jgi:hypothetical protein
MRELAPREGVLSCRFQLLSFTTLFTLFESAAMPRFVFGVDRAEPLLTNAAMARGGSITRLAYGGYVADYYARKDLAAARKSQTK